MEYVIYVYCVDGWFENVNIQKTVVSKPFSQIVPYITVKTIYRLIFVRFSTTIAIELCLRHYCMHTKKITSQITLSPVRAFALCIFYQYQQCKANNNIMNKSSKLEQKLKKGTKQKNVDVKTGIMETTKYTRTLTDINIETIMQFIQTPYELVHTLQE